MRIIGVDPGLINTGYGVIDMSEAGKLSCLAAGVIKPDTKEMAGRMLHIHDKLRDVLHEFIPDAMAVEELYASYAFPKTAILMGHARGVIYLTAAERAVPVIGYASTAIKSAVTGNGHANKSQVQSMVQRILALPNEPIPDHVSDALAMAICHAYRANSAIARRGR